MPALIAGMVGLMVLVLAKGDPLGIVSKQEKLFRLGSQSGYGNRYLQIGKVKFILPSIAILIADKYIRFHSRYREKLNGSLGILSESSSITAEGYVALKFMMVSLPAAFAIILALLDRLMPSLILLAAASSIWFLTDLILGSRVAQRRREFTYTMPSIIDLLIVCTGAGLSLAKGIELLAEGDDPIARELRNIPRELSAGKGLSDVLRSFASRFKVPALARFVNAIIQGEVLGTSVNEVLRIQATETRTAIRQDMELVASTIPVKLTFCALVFLLPSVFTVVVVPNLLSITAAPW